MNQTIDTKNPQQDAVDKWMDLAYYAMLSGGGSRTIVRTFLAAAERDGMVLTRIPEPCPDATSIPVVTYPVEGEGYAALRTERDAAMADAFALSAAACPHAYSHENGSLRCTEIDTLRAENARLRDALIALFDAGVIPKSSAKEGGAMRYSSQVAAADLARAALEPKP